MESRKNIHIHVFHLPSYHVGLCILLLRFLAMSETTKSWLNNKCVMIFGVVLVNIYKLQLFMYLFIIFLLVPANIWGEGKISVMILFLWMLSLHPPESILFLNNALERHLKTRTHITTKQQLTLNIDTYTVMYLLLQYCFSISL